MEMNLLIEVEDIKDNDTLKTVIGVVINNINNYQIKKIHIFTKNTSLLSDIESEKVKVIDVTEKMTFKNYFDYINSNIDDNEICIISNSDIVFDNSLIQLNRNFLNGKFLALNKWIDNQVDQSRNQDTWIFNSPINIKSCDFPPFNNGADHRIAYLANESDYIVTNPCGTIITTSKFVNKRDNFNPIKGKHCYLRLTKDIHVISPNNIKIQD